MRKHRIALLLLMAGLGVVIVALHQPTATATAADRSGNAGGTAALVSAHLADDSLSPATTTTTGGGATTPPTRNVALDSLRSTGATTTTTTTASGPTTVVDIPAAGQSTTTTGTTTPPTATTSETTTVPTVTTVPNAPPIVAAIAPTAPAGGVWAELRWCESRGNYADNTGNGYYGAYQFSLQTWEGIGYSGLPSSAPPAVQDQAAQRLQARSGWGQWPACAAHLGLL